MGEGVSSLFFGIGGAGAGCCGPGRPAGGVRGGGAVPARRAGDLPASAAQPCVPRRGAGGLCVGGQTAGELQAPDGLRGGRRRRGSVPFDGGTKEFLLEKGKGRVCMALSSKALVITGIADRRYWTHMPTAESRFQSVAYLQQIWWFEVVGELDLCFPVGTYSLYFRIHLGKFYKLFGRCVCSSEHVHGWDKKPVRFQLATCDGQHALSQCYLDEPGSWVLYHPVDFVASKPDHALKLKFSMAQIDCTHTKGGLCVDSVLVYPKGFQQEKVELLRVQR